MVRMSVSQILECNRAIYRIMEQRTLLSVSTGLKLNRIMKAFDEVEDYVFETMDAAFGRVEWGNLTQEHLSFYAAMVSEQVEMDIDMIPAGELSDNGNIMLDLHDIECLSVILC